MSNFFSFIFAPASADVITYVLCAMRIAIGLLTIGHGFPKIIAGPELWHTLGLMTSGVGITFWPTMWGFLGACTEFFGGIALMLGFGTRIACLALVIMMFVAFKMHFDKGDSYNVYSLALTLLVVYAGYFFIGGGVLSLDSYL